MPVGQSIEPTTVPNIPPSRVELGGELSQLAVQDESPESEGTGGVVRVPDYIAISVLVVLAVWAVAEWIPRDKL